MLCSCFSACRGGRGCTLCSCFSASRGGRGCTPRSCFFSCRGGRGCTPRSCFSPCREGKSCSSRSCFSACREDRGCTQRSCFSPCRGDRGCSPHSCLSASREGRGCTPRSCFSPCRGDRGRTLRRHLSACRASIALVCYSPFVPDHPRAAMCGRAREERGRRLQSSGKSRRCFCQNLVFGSKSSDRISAPLLSRATRHRTSYRRVHSTTGPRFPGKDGLRDECCFRGFRDAMRGDVDATTRSRAFQP